MPRHIAFQPVSNNVTPRFIHDVSARITFACLACPHGTFNDELHTKLLLSDAYSNACMCLNMAVLRKRKHRCARDRARRFDAIWRVDGVSAGLVELRTILCCFCCCLRRRYMPSRSRDGRERKLEPPQPNYLDIPGAFGSCLAMSG